MPSIFFLFFWRKDFPFWSEVAIHLYAVRFILLVKFESLTQRRYHSTAGGTAASGPLLCLGTYIFVNGIPPCNCTLGKQLEVSAGHMQLALSEA